jgi:hypothetical protein
VRIILAHSLRQRKQKGAGGIYVLSMFPDSLEIVIQGVTLSGQPFRPSDWAERLCGMMSAFSEDRHLSYSPYLKPIITAGVRCVVLDVRLEQLDPAALPLPAGIREGQRAQGAAGPQAEAAGRCRCGDAGSGECRCAAERKPEGVKSPASGKA